jgi:bacillopeptidase F (M6 metalloprotease family)
MGSHYPITITPHSGTWLAWLGGESSATTYIQRQVSVPADHPYLAYWHWIDSTETGCSYDFGKVLINSTVVNNYGLCKTTNTSGWVKHVVNLSSYAGQSVTLQIRTTTNGTLNSNLFVDDVCFQSDGTSSMTSTSDSPGVAPQAAWVTKQDMGD